MVRGRVTNRINQDLGLARNARVHVTLRMH